LGDAAFYHKIKSKEESIIETNDLLLLKELLCSLVV